MVSGRIQNLLIAVVFLITTAISGQGPDAPVIVVAQNFAVPIPADNELPFKTPPINYSDTKPRDRVARLGDRLERGEISWQKTGSSGVLKQLLDELQIPVASQLLVFSKSSAQARLIKPTTPRAIYFNDEVYVGWVPGSSLIEISAAEPDLGGTFYSLLQTENSKVQLRREGSCLLCHLTRNTLRVPGHLVRSFNTDALGNLQTGWSRTTHETAFEKRWAGWYVTGPAQVLGHQGNVFGGSALASVDQSPAQHPFDVTKVCDLTGYLSAESDVLPHLVLDHQAHGHNLITRLNYEARLDQPITALEPLVRYLLFLDEVPFPGPVIGNADYRRWFEQQGPRDSHERSLREFDLRTRLFKYHLSYLVYTPSFAALPMATRFIIWGRIKECLTANGSELHSAGTISPAERDTILEIARATVTELPEGW